MGNKNSTFNDADVGTSSPPEKELNDTPTKRNPALNNLYKEIVRECYDHSHGETAMRICMRMSQQRVDFRDFIEAIAPELKQEFVDTMGAYLNNVVVNIDDSEEITSLSTDYGEYHIGLKNFGFKPDFFAVAADAIATECVFLGGQATAHAPANTFRAWTILVGLMFSGVRDGYYAALRKMRRQSPSNLIENLAKMSITQTQTPPAPRRRMLPSTNSEGSFDSTTTTGSPRVRPVHYLNDSPSASNSTSRISSPSDSPQLPRNAVVQRQTTFYIRETRPYMGSHSAFGAAQSCDGINLIATRDRIRRHQKINYTNSNDEVNFISHQRVSSAGSVPSNAIVGRFTKNPPAMAPDQEIRRRQRIEDISRRHDVARLANHGKKSVSASNLFDPNKIMSDFINDRLYAHN
ncbi:hypothetical protein L596_018105 [Steinernema carpocapsae]|uniref:Globin family profile domain-containing protein n=1 Tax=Steinernema carpocapsae TaxID=34508 RepID=A0A4U5N3N5_STECR|nr:hypothetical protein L596_018105 [Steinernema carpocapsae]